MDGAMLEDRLAMKSNRSLRRTLSVLLATWIVLGCLAPVLPVSDDLEAEDKNLRTVADEVERVEVELYDSPFFSRNVPKFKLPADSVTEFLSFFKNAEKDPRPNWRFREIGPDRPPFWRVWAIVLVLG